MQTDNKDNRLRLNKEEMELIKLHRETGTIPDTYLINSDLNVNKLRGKHAELQRRYKTTLEELEHANIQINTLIDLKNVKIEKMVFGEQHKGQTGNATAIMVASDWHLEEKVEPAQVSGKNQYNIQIAAKRATKFFEKGLFLTNLIRQGIKINRLVLALLGDFISGYIHEELMEDNQLSPTEAILFCKKILFSGIEKLLEDGDFDEIIIPCCYGNHGRTGQKMKISTGYKNSFEWLMYKDLETHFQKESKVKIIVSNGYHNTINLYGKYPLRFHHGDSIKYGGGIGGITVPGNRAIAQWNTQGAAYLDIFGHFHQFIDVGNFICNGSLIGYNAFANSIKAPFEEPRQGFFVIDADRGKILTAPIFVE